MSKKEDDKIIVRAKPNFPFECYVLVFAMLFLLVVTIVQIFYNGHKELEWFGLLIGNSILFGTSIWISGYQYKNLIIYHDKLIIKKLFNPKVFNLGRDEVKGFESFQIFGRSGLQYWIRIVTASNKKFTFVKENYSNYDKIISGLRNSGMTYLGEKEMKWKYKAKYEKLIRWSVVIFPFIYLLFLLMKAAKF